MFLQKVIVYLGHFSLITSWEESLYLNWFLFFNFYFSEVLVEILKILQQKHVQNLKITFIFF